MHFILYFLCQSLVKSEVQIVMLVVLFYFVLVPLFLFFEYSMQFLGYFLHRGFS